MLGIDFMIVISFENFNTLLPPRFECVNGCDGQTRIQLTLKAGAGRLFWWS